MLRPAIALNSAGFNLARTVGPVLGQILLGLVGVFLLFAINACTYIGVIFAMASWKRSAEARASQRREGFLEAARTGIAFVRGSGELKAVFARGLCFFVPGIAIGTLLPVIGRFELGLDEFSFGVLYAVFGVGAVAGAMPDADRQPPARPRSRQHLGNGHARRGHADRRACHDAATWSALCVAVVGACWITVIANNGTAVQMILPNFMRARGMAVHQMVFFGAMVVGSLFWGKIADAVRHADLADRLGRSAGALHRARRVDPAAGLDRCLAADTLVCFFEHKTPKISQAGKNPLVTASISCIYEFKTPNARAAGP